MANSRWAHYGVRVAVKARTLAAARRGMAEGLAVIGERTLEIAKPPDQPPVGAGLVETGGWAVYEDGRMVAGNVDNPPVPPDAGLHLYVGYGFPARFNEMGTIHQPARPFLTPAMLEALDDLPDAERAAVRKHLEGVT